MYLTQHYHMTRKTQRYFAETAPNCAQHHKAASKIYLKLGKMQHLQKVCDSVAPAKLTQTKEIIRFKFSCCFLIAMQSTMLCTYESIR